MTIDLARRVWAEIINENGPALFVITGDGIRVNGNKGRDPPAPGWNATIAMYPATRPPYAPEAKASTLTLNTAKNKEAAAIKWITQTLVGVEAECARQAMATRVWHECTQPDRAISLAGISEQVRDWVERSSSSLSSRSSLLHRLADDVLLVRWTDLSIGDASYLLEHFTTPAWKIRNAVRAQEQT